MNSLDGLGSGAALHGGDAGGFYQLVRARQTQRRRPILLVLTTGWMQAITKIPSWILIMGNGKTTKFALPIAVVRKLFHLGDTAVGLFNLVYDDYPQV